MKNNQIYKEYIVECNITEVESNNRKPRKINGAFYVIFALLLMCFILKLISDKIDNSFSVDDKFEYVRCEVRDFEEYSVIEVYFDYTNGDKKPKSYYNKYKATAFQNDVELEIAFERDCNKLIEQNETIRIMHVFYLRDDLDSPIKVRRNNRKNDAFEEYTIDIPKR